MPQHDHVHLPQSIFQSIAQHCVAGYPDEVCGLLVGRRQEITAWHPIANVWPNLAERRRRFTLDPLAQLRLERSLDGTDQSVIGSFHSHPDHPAEPSDFDFEAAWAGQIYLIVPITRGNAGLPRAWLIDDTGHGFVEKHLLIESL